MVKAAPDVPSRDAGRLPRSSSSTTRRNVAAAVRAVANAPEGGVVIHCAGGKDRTGLVTAFLLHIAGVGTDEIAKDYALSEERLRTRHEEWLAQAESEEERERLERISQTPADSMRGVFEELERRYGSVEGYLRHGGPHRRRARPRPRAPPELTL